MRPSRHRLLGPRLLGLALLLLQLGLPTVVSALEFTRDAGSTGQVIHIESEDSEDCALHHDHHFCQVVRNLTEGQRGAVAPPAAVLRSAAASSPRPAPRMLEHRSLWLQELHASRAPPAT